MGNYVDILINVKSHKRKLKNGKIIRVRQHSRRVSAFKAPKLKKRIKPLFLKQPQEIKRRANQRIMTKEIPENLIQGIKKITKNNDFEYAIAIDFERKFEQPERMFILKSGRSETIKIDDFELYGHTHPGHYCATPSTADLWNMKLLKPEFIIAGKSSHAILLNIENLEKYNAWKEDGWERQQRSGKSIGGTNPIDVDVYKKANIKVMRDENDSMFYHALTRSKRGRDLIYEETGVRIYPFKGKVKIEMIDDPNPEKELPKVSQRTLIKWHELDDVRENKGG